LFKGYKNFAQFCFAIEEAAFDFSFSTLCKHITPPTPSASQNTVIFCIAEFRHSAFSYLNLSKGFCREIQYNFSFICRIEMFSSIERDEKNSFAPHNIYPTASEYNTCFIFLERMLLITSKKY